MPEVEQQAAVPEDITGEEGAISMAVNPVGGPGNMAFVVTCYSFQPPRVQMDETGAPTPMTETTPPAPPNPGQYQDTVTFTSAGDHEIICFNAVTRVRQRVFAGNIPAWDPLKYQLTAREIAANERAKAVKIFSTKSKLNG